MATVSLTIKLDAEGNVTAIDDAGRSLDNLEKSGQNAERQLERVRMAQDRLATAAIGVGAVTAAMGYKFAEAASALNEAQNQTTVIFGQSADAVRKFGEDAGQAVGMSERQALAAASSYGQLFQTIGGVGPAAAADMSTSLVTLAADWASFRDMRPEDTLAALRSGLVGEIEPLRNLGISFNQAQVEAKAMELGLAGVGGELSEGAKMQARYALIMEQSKQISGDFARTSDGMANSQRIARAEMENAAAAAGQALMPAMTALMKAATPALEVFSALAKTPVGRWAIVAATGLGLMAGIAGTVYKAYMGLRAASATVKLAMGLETLAVRTNTAALGGETAALGTNTAAQNANAAAAGRAAAARGVGSGAKAAAGGLLGRAGGWIAGAGGALTGGAGLGGLLGTSVGGIGALGAGAIGTAGALAVGAGAAGYGIGALVRAPLYRSGALGRGMQEHQQQLDRYAAARREVGGYQQQLAGMSSAERRQMLGTAPTTVININGDIYDGQRFEERVARVAGRVVNGR